MTMIVPRSRSDLERGGATRRSHHHYHAASPDEEFQQSTSAAGQGSAAADGVTPVSPARKKAIVAHTSPVLKYMRIRVSASKEKEDTPRPRFLGDASS